MLRYDKASIQLDAVVANMGADNGLDRYMFSYRNPLKAEWIITLDWDLLLTERIQRSDQPTENHLSHIFSTQTMPLELTGSCLSVFSFIWAEFSYTDSDCQQTVGISMLSVIVPKALAFRGSAVASIQNYPP